MARRLLKRRQTWRPSAVLTRSAADDPLLRSVCREHPPGQGLQLRRPCVSGRASACVSGRGRAVGCRCPPRARRRAGRDARDVPRRCRPPRLPQGGRGLDGARGPVEPVSARHRNGGAGPGRQAREGRPEGRLHPDHLRDADHHGGADGLLCQAGSQRRRGQDRRLGGDPRQDPEQGIRRRPHVVADAARHLHGRRLQPGALHDPGDREHQRPGHHPGDEAQGQARSEVLEGLQARRAV